MFDPVKYEKFSEFQQEDARKFVPYMVSKMKRKPMETVMDFGCGSGFTTKSVLFPALESMRAHDGLTPSLQVYGIDMSKPMVDYASDNHAHPKITYLVADIMKDDTEIHLKFDKIFSFHVLHWVDQRIALERLYNLLKSDGEIGFYCIANAGVFLVYNCMSRNPKWSKYMCDVKRFIPNSYFRVDPAKDMHDLMTSIGYQVNQSSTYIRQFRFESLDNLMETAIAANPFIHRIPDDLKTEYVEDFRKSIRPIVRSAPSKKSPNAVEVDYSILLVRAQK